MKRAPSPLALAVTLAHALFLPLGILFGFPVILRLSFPGLHFPWDPLYGSLRLLHAGFLVNGWLGLTLLALAHARIREAAGRGLFSHRLTWLSLGLHGALVILGSASMGDPTGGREYGSAVCRLFSIAWLAALVNLGLTMIYRRRIRPAPDCVFLFVGLLWGLGRYLLGGTILPLFTSGASSVLWRQFVDKTAFWGMLLPLALVHGWQPASGGNKLGLNHFLLCVVVFALPFACLARLPAGLVSPERMNVLRFLGTGGLLAVLAAAIRVFASHRKAVPALPSPGTRARFRFGAILIGMSSVIGLLQLSPGFGDRVFFTSWSSGHQHILLLGVAFWTLGAVLVRIPHSQADKNRFSLRSRVLAGSLFLTAILFVSGLLIWGALDGYAASLSLDWTGSFTGFARVPISLVLLAGVFLSVPIAFTACDVLSLMVNREELRLEARQGEEPPPSSVQVPLYRYVLPAAVVGAILAILFGPMPGARVGESDGVSKALSEGSDAHRCVACHTAWIRPLELDVTRFGPPTSSADIEDLTLPPLGRRRIGPDLWRQGVRRSEDWHVAHLFDPRTTSPRSAMPRFAGVFFRWDDPGGDPKLTRQGRQLIALLRRGMGQNEPRPVSPRSDPVIERPLVTRDHFLEPITHGRSLYQDYCLGCHGDVVEITRAGQNWVAASGRPLATPEIWRIHTPDGFFVDPETETAFAVEPSKSRRLEENETPYSSTPVAFVRGDAFPFLSPKPRDFSLGIFKFRSTLRGYPPLEGDLFRTLAMGVPGSSMPAFPSLPEWDRWALVDYLMTLPPGFPEWPRWSRTDFAYPIPESVIVRVPGAVTPDSDLAREEWTGKGRAVYVLSGCWRCHGVRMDGRGPDAEGLVDVWGYAVRPYSFASKQPARSGGRPSDFYRTIMTGIGGTPMPSYADDAVFIPGREEVANLDSLYHEFPRHVFQELQSYVRALPESSEILVWPGPVTKAVADERRWALVSFLMEYQSRD